MRVLSDDSVSKAKQNVSGSACVPWRVQAATFSILFAFSFYGSCPLRGSAINTNLALYSSRGVNVHVKRHVGHERHIATRLVSLIRIISHVNGASHWYRPPETRYFMFNLSTGYRSYSIAMITPEFSGL